MNVLILGSGGREHALASAVAKSPLLDKLYVAPGNPGCETISTLLPISPTDSEAVLRACRERRIDFVIVGPEAPLVAGIVDALGAAGVAAFGPTQAAARLEGSKGFTKDFCAEFGIPTAAYRRFGARQSALAYVRRNGAPIVIKADGLAAGKGVVVATTLAEAEAAVEALYAHDPRAECVVEACLAGVEVSFFALCDGRRAVAFGDAQDHKRAGDGDTGPNTGGMGAYSPSGAMTPALSRRVMETIVEPTLAGMIARGSPFRGLLFAGLMLTETGPQLLEYNVRFGDPETEAILPRFRGDLLPWLRSAAAGELIGEQAPLAEVWTCAVVMAAQGYPGVPVKGDAIGGLERASANPDVRVFHAGTRREGSTIVSDGGRVLVITGLGETVGQARERAYGALREVDWSRGFYRNDIAARAASEA